MSKYKHILLDVDGTLIDTYQANVSSLKEILERYKDSGEKPLGLPSGWKPQIINLWVSLSKFSYV